MINLSSLKPRPDENADASIYAPDRQVIEVSIPGYVQRGSGFDIHFEYEVKVSEFPMVTRLEFSVTLTLLCILVNNVDMGKRQRADFLQEWMVNGVTLK